MVEIAILGFGTVGSGVAELIDKNQDKIRRAVPEGVHVKYILDIREFPGSPYADRVVHDLDQIVSDPQIQVICETMGGKEPAYSFSKKALEHGISVCTSNKELVEAYGSDLMETARANGAGYLFEASVGGGIPILRPLRTSLAQEEITEVLGILNGTTNYILTRMERNGEAFDAVLADAQANGYAERNPAADIEGHDCARKIAILASLITGKKADYDRIPCEGITGITAADFAAASALGYAIKLLGAAKKEESGSWSVRTAPFLVPEGHPLYPVSDVFNGIWLHGNMVDDLMFYGRGAGKDATASAVVADVIELAQGGGKAPAWTEEKLPLSDGASQKSRFLMRLSRAEEEAARLSFENSAGEDTLTAVPDPDGILAAANETALLTGIISEREFEDRTAGLQLHGRIRVL